MLGKNTQQATSEWKQCFDETSQSIYYWNTKSNECSWDRPATSEQIESNGDHTRSDGSSGRKRPQTTDDRQSPKKTKQASLIAEYASSDSEETVDEIDELLNEVMEKPTPPFESDHRAAIARLASLGDRTAEVLSLRVQLEVREGKSDPLDIRWFQTRLEDALAGQLSKGYVMNKLEEALRQIEALEQSSITSTPLP